MKEPRKKPELTDLEKADCLTGKMIGGIALKTPGWGTGKRRRFVFSDRTSCYHVMSRVAGGELLFGDIEKEAFRKLMRRMERFSGVEVLTYAVMGNHFHLLLRVPQREAFLRKFEKGTRLEREERLFDHLKLLYSQAYLTQLKAELAVIDPKDYRWCGYAEALGGSKRARRGLCVILGMTVATWESAAQESYRRLLLGEGMEASEEVKESEARQGRKYRRRGLDRAEALSELRDGKALGKAELLRCRVRYFSDGLVLGSRDFVENAFQEKREWFGSKRKSGARGLPVEGGGLFSLRDLKVQALE